MRKLKEYWYLAERGMIVVKENPSRKFHMLLRENIREIYK